MNEQQETEQETAEQGCLMHYGPGVLVLVVCLILLILLVLGYIQPS